MKKLLCVILSLTMIVVLTACGGNPPADSGGAADPPTTAGTSAVPETDELEWPKAAIKIICPYSAGGASDLISRIVAEKLTEMLGVSVIVEDLTGGSGSVGMAALANAKPDGYTIGMTALGAATVVSNQNDTGYDNTSFAPISQVTLIPNVMAVNVSLGVSNWQELLDYAHTNGPISWGCSGIASVQNMIVTLSTASVGESDSFKLVPFEGGADSVAALLGNQIQATVNVMSEPYPYVQDGSFVPMWVTAKNDFYPDTPTLEELGMEGSMSNWYGFAAPAGTDERILDRLDQCISEILEMPDVIEQFGNIGNPVVYADRQSFSDTWQASWDQSISALRTMDLCIR